MSQPLAIWKNRNALLAAALLFAACVFLYTRCNSFPFFYHGDEPGKVAQVLENTWNFHHPVLMLGAAKTAVRVLNVPRENQPIVIVGRWLSACFAALGVSALALLAGIGLVFLALGIFEERRTKIAELFLGAACGLSASAKYVGIATAIPALIVIFLAQKSLRETEGQGTSRAAAFALFAAGLAAAFAIINFPLLANFQTARVSFRREMDLVAPDHDVSHRVPNSEYLKIFVSNSNVAIWLLLAFFLVRFFRDSRSRSLTQWCAIFFPLAFMLALSFSPKTNDRYFLPCSALFGFVAGLGAVDAAEFLKKRFPVFARASFGFSLGLVLALTAFFQIISIPLINKRSLWSYFDAFRHDDRKELTDWIRKNLPRDAVIAQDSWVNLPTAARPDWLKIQTPLPQKIVGGITPLAEVESLSDLAQQGVTHVVISENDYGKYRRAAPSRGDEKQSDFLRKKNFYDALLNSGEPLWQRSRSTVIYLHPGLRVYRLPGSASEK